MALDRSEVMVLMRRALFLIYDVCAYAGPLTRNTCLSVCACFDLELDGLRGFKQC